LLKSQETERELRSGQKQDDAENRRREDPEHDGLARKRLVFARIRVEAQVELPDSLRLAVSRPS